MELQQMTTETDGGKEDGGTKEPTRGLQKTEEEPEHYSKLSGPSEDVYTEARSGDSSVKAKGEEDSKQEGAAENVYTEAHFGRFSGKQAERKVRLYRVGCLVLTVLCLVLLLVVIVLSMKLQTVCTAGVRDVQLSDCSYEQCQAHYSDGQGHVGGCNQCPPAWLAHENSCYFLSQHRLSWKESQRYCAANGGTLAVINSQKLQIFLTEQGNLMYWIGLIHKGNKWSWVNNESVQKSYWASNVSPAGCGILNSRDPPEKNWLSHNCDNYTYFICQLHLG